MNDMLLTNLFFVITGAAVLVVATFVCIVCYHTIKITQKARTILERVETSAESFAHDVQALRDRIANGTIFSRIRRAVASAMKSTKPKRVSPPKRKPIISQEQKQNNE